MRTNAGTTFQAGVMGSATSAPGAYLALTANATAPAATDTVLTCELAAVSGGLIRALGAFAYTSPNGFYTLTKTFTANANDGASNTVSKMGVFTATAAGTLVFESLVPNAPTLVPGDSIALTETVNI